jgi:hypothetical protein
LTIPSLVQRDPGLQIVGGSVLLLEQKGAVLAAACHYGADVSLP